MFTKMPFFARRIRWGWRSFSCTMFCGATLNSNLCQKKTCLRLWITASFFTTQDARKNGGMDQGGVGRGEKMVVWITGTWGETSTRLAPIPPRGSCKSRPAYWFKKKIDCKKSNKAPMQEWLFHHHVYQWRNVSTDFCQKFLVLLSPPDSTPPPPKKMHSPPVPQLSKKTRRTKLWPRVGGPNSVFIIYTNPYYLLAKDHRYSSFYLG